MECDINNVLGDLGVTNPDWLVMSAGKIQRATGFGHFSHSIFLILFSFLGFYQVLETLFPWHEFIVQEIYWDDPSKVGGGIAFPAEPSAPSSLLISILGWLEPSGSQEVSYASSTGIIWQTSKKRRIKNTVASPSQRVLALHQPFHTGGSVYLDFCRYFTTRERASTCVLRDEQGETFEQATLAKESCHQQPDMSLCGGKLSQVTWRLALQFSEVSQGNIFRAHLGRVLRSAEPTQTWFWHPLLEDLTA